MKVSRERTGVRRDRKAADFLDEIILERAAANPEFPRLVEAALDRRRLLRALAAERERRGIPQQAVARKMRTSQPAVARLETGEVDARLSTVERYAAAVGRRLRYQLVPARSSRGRRAADPIRGFIGGSKGGPPDASLEHDRYSYRKDR